MRDCSVCECPPDEVPQLWKDAEAGTAGDGTCLSRKQPGMLAVLPPAHRTRTLCFFQVYACHHYLRATAVQAACKLSARLKLLWCILIESATAAASVQRVDEGTRSRLLNIHGWRGFNNPWMPLDEEDVDFSYINLQQNPERYTGYKVRALPCCTFCAVRVATLIGPGR
jgi:Endoplasmic Reticulum Oxidoreductin 1 (ERO1)